MESRYDAEAAQRMVRDLSSKASELLALRTYTARLIGAEPSLVLHGGGNTSVKATATTCLGETIACPAREGLAAGTWRPSSQRATRRCGSSRCGTFARSVR